MPKKIKVKNYKHTLKFIKWDDDESIILYYRAVGLGIIACELQELILDQIELFLISAGGIKNKKEIKLNLHGWISPFDDDDDDDPDYKTNKDMIKILCPDFQYQAGFPLLIQITINNDNILLNDFYNNIHNFNKQLKTRREFHNSVKIMFESNQQIAVKFKNIQPILD